ncbi:hypothetical protein Ssi03_63510 [Sphaerisporangium siamense]|uniref:DUF397 domain-containing protein n=1 Tax=Sphaerisporangium siamense TaxID=795645 RepID=A0A7W7D7P2_9ACTN|nr:DUF397 domain-containing protein [Sphaerisporangium siamense]MBB4700476.1 hypothetical protein [Sphaerisporangium siamense]GII88361.1 hypothetical protein Ssi03_63510 [Sphaerisporangium siamense]
MNDKLRPYAQWRKSSYSNNGGACVEVAVSHDASRAEHGAEDRSLYLVRDSKDIHGPILGFSRAGWGAFRTALKNGDL